MFAFGHFFWDLFWFIIVAQNIFVLGLLLIVLIAIAMTPESAEQRISRELRRKSEEQAGARWRWP